MCIWREVVSMVMQVFKARAVREIGDIMTFGGQGAESGRKRSNAKRLQQGKASRTG